MEILNYRERQGKSIEEIQDSSRLMGYSVLIILAIFFVSLFNQKTTTKNQDIAKASSAKITEYKQSAN